MDKNFDDNNLKKAIKKIHVEPSDEWRESTLDSLKLLSKHGEVASFEEKSASEGGRFTLSNYLFTNFFTMKKAFALIVVIALVGLGYYQFFYSPSVVVEESSQVDLVQIHLDNAREALSQIEAYTKGEGLPTPELSSLFIPAAYADEDEDEQLEELLEELAEETDAAIEAAEEIEDAEDVVEVLAEIDALQDDTVDILSDLIEIVEDEELTEVVLAVIEDTVEENEEIEVAQDQAEEAVFKGKAEGKGQGKKLGLIKFKFSVLTDIDEDEGEDDGEGEGDGEGEDEEDEEFGLGYEQEPVKKQEQIQARIEQSEELISSFEFKVEAENINLTPTMQRKYETVQEIIGTCGTGEGDCNSGKAKGLSTALEAKVKNVIRKKEKEEYKFGYGSGKSGNVPSDKGGKGGK